MNVWAVEVQGQPAIVKFPSTFACLNKTYKIMMRLLSTAGEMTDYQRYVYSYHSHTNVIVVRNYNILCKTFAPVKIGRKHNDLRPNSLLIRHRDIRYNTKYVQNPKW